MQIKYILFIAQSFLWKIFIHLTLFGKSKELLKISHEEEFERLVYKNESKHIELGKRVGNAFAAGRALKRLPIELQIFGTIGWESLATTINQSQDQLRHHIEGEILCTFIVSYLNGNRKTKISYIIFNNGMDCLKSFLELLLDENIGLNPIIKNGFKILFDFYKEKTKESFRRENLLSYP